VSRPAEASERPLLIFDGDCGFCTTSAAWVECHLSAKGAIAPWQLLGEDGLSSVGLSVDQVNDAAWWVDEAGQTFRGHLAVGKSLAACRPPWRWLGWAALLPPGRWIGQAVYPLVSRYRSRLPGGTPACRVRR